MYFEEKKKEIWKNLYRREIEFSENKKKKKWILGMKHYDCSENCANAEMERTNGHNVTVERQTHELAV